MPETVHMRRFESSAGASEGGKKKQRSAENMTREEWIQFSVISVIYAIVHITIELIKERRKK